MTLISVKEYAELCGDKAKDVEVWITRGKVIVNRDTGKKLIDTENPVNALFIQQRQDAHGQKKLLGEGVKSVIVEPKKDKPVTKISKKVTEPKPDKPVKAKEPVKAPIEPKVTLQMKRAEAKRMNDQNMRAMIKVDQEAQMRQQNIDLAELRIQSEKIRLDKTAGNLLPIDLGLGVIERHANSILKTFEKGFERIADIYANFAGMDPNTRTDFIKECRIELSHCVETAGKSAEAEIDILVDNYAETLMVGQKKA